MHVGWHPYPSGIGGNGRAVDELSITLQSGVTVTIPAGSPRINAVNVANSEGVISGIANITISADGTTIDNIANPLGDNQTGLRVQSSGEAIIAATNTSINVNSTASDWAILAIAQPNDDFVSHLASVTYGCP